MYIHVRLRVQRYGESGNGTIPKIECLGNVPIREWKEGLISNRYNCTFI